MIKKICFLLFCFLALNHSAYSFEFRPSLSLLGSYTITRNNTYIKAGAFDVHNRKVNLGFEFTNKFYLPNNYFIKTGLRYNQYKTSIVGKNKIAALFDKPYPLSWERGYESVAIPILFGKDFITHKENKGDFYIGLSAGILMTSYAKTQVSSSFSRNIYNLDLISAEISDKNNQTPSFFFPTVDFGGSYQPFKSAPRFNVGILCSIQLNKTDPYSYQGVVRNETRGEEFIYDIQHQQRFINCALSLSYTFGKQKSLSQKSNKLDCPR